MRLGLAVLYVPVACRQPDDHMHIHVFYNKAGAGCGSSMVFGSSNDSHLMFPGYGGYYNLQSIQVCAFDSQ